jgi:hypothetical protein
MSDVSDQVAAILAAAEHTAEALRKQAEERASERIAEADRAAGHRIAAARADAAELRQSAEAEADAIVRAAHDERGRLLARAEEATADVLEKGMALSEALDQVGRSFQVNAKRVLQDVMDAHAHLRAPLADGASRRHGRPPRDAPPAASDADELELPRFLRRR